MMMTKPDYDRTLTGIKQAISAVLCRGCEPDRLYMNSRTYSALFSVFRRIEVCIIPEGKRTPTIYGVRIAISDDLLDEYIDVSVKLS